LDDTRNFMLDILSGNQNAIMFKSAEFLKRKVKRGRARIYILHNALIWLKNVIVEGVKHTVHGLKDFGADSKWLIQTKTQKQKYSLASYSQEKKARNVRQDVMKMIPFSFFLVIPGAEALLPAYLKIFPNSLPS